MDFRKLGFDELKSVVSYLFFGVCTTGINLASYYILYEILNFGNITATISAWLFAVIFAFITNKLFVFGSKDLNMKVILYETITFFSCRILTGVLDVIIMYLAVDIMGWHAMIWKLISNVLVIILNYLASKLIIFKRK